VSTVSIASVAKLAASARQEADRVAWDRWKTAPTDTNASALLAQVNPIIQKEASKWAGTLARPLLETEGKRLAMHAFQTFDPSKGAALGTHLTNTLQRMSRLSYANQNVARLPENQMLQYHSYHVAHSELSDALGRAPTADELADRLAWPTKRVEEYRKAVGRRETLEGGGLFDTTDVGADQAGHEDRFLDLAYHDLPPLQQAMFEGLTGYRESPVLSNQALQKKLNLTQGQYSYAKAKLIAHMEAAQNKSK
jgi:DNA-directed RNA polymerase specialized sigma subunit